MTAEQLSFPGMPGPAEGPASAGGKSGWGSAGKRRTQRQHAVIQAGGHPLGLALDGPLAIHRLALIQDRTCGNCRFRSVINTGSSRSHPKCLIEKGPSSRSSLARGSFSRVSAGPGTDVRKWWPGCTDHEWGDNDLSPDAARSGPPDESE